MKKWMITTISIAVASYLIGLIAYLPWYSFVIVAAIIAFITKPSNAFISGFVAIFILWLVQCFIIDNANAHILSTRVANIFPLGGNYIVLIIITALIGGIAGGLGALCGKTLRGIIDKNGQVVS